MGGTRSVYLTLEEEAGLHELAAHNNVPANAVLRIALRRLLGLPAQPLERPGQPAQAARS